MLRVLTTGLPQESRQLRTGSKEKSRNDKRLMRTVPTNLLVKAMLEGVSFAVLCTLLILAAPM